MNQEDKAKDILRAKSIEGIADKGNLKDWSARAKGNSFRAVRRIRSCGTNKSKRSFRKHP